MSPLLERLKQAAPEQAWADLATDAAGRLERLAEASPLYAGLLEQHPAWALWLEAPQNLREEFRFRALHDEWLAFHAAQGAPERTATEYLRVLRRFRRKMSLRIAYRDVTELASDEVTVAELTRLAEFCLRECHAIALAQWTRRLGEPWDEATGRPARFCGLALGKLGGRELNFSSDIDLIYLYEGEGSTRRENRPTTTTNGEFFHHLGETLTQLLNQADADGFLFRADLRLRPGGEAAPLVPSIEAVENYYAATAQTWERLALIKARPVVGDTSLGGELLENLHSFRYPRHPPPALLAEVAEMKARTEREVVGREALERDVKSGYGGIREVEFIAQVLQLLHAGRFPFLQTHATVEALRQLVRYDLLDAADATALEQAYWFLRRVEHRLQMAEERQTHELPADPEERARVARSLGFASLASFDARMTEVRREVRGRYSRLFQNERTPGGESASVADAWWGFFADGKVTPAVRERLATWFGGERADDPAALRELQLFVRGSELQPLLRDQVQRFISLLPALDRVLPRLARPRAALNRIAAFGERYSSRHQFLAACTLNPQFFEALALLFDRSRFIHELLVRHPEIFDEILRPEILHKRKDLAARRRELAEGPTGDDEAFTSWLWLYVRAEQVRAAAGQLLGFLDEDHVEAELSDLAEAVLLDLAARTPGGEQLLVVALGKIGGRELSFGSDLDIVFVRPADGVAIDCEAVARALLRRVSSRTGRDPIFDVDLRLRPHGDAGPLVPSVEALRSYFASSAQLWERQVFTRARVLGGPPEVAREWREFIDQSIHAPGLSAENARELWQMRLRVQKERDVVEPPERAFKTGAGGMIDVEFALRMLQLRYGHEHPEIRTPHTATGWRLLAQHGLVDPEIAGRLLENYQRLKQIEACLRRDENRRVTTLPADPDAQQALACWLGVENWPAFWAEHCARMQATRRAVAEVLGRVLPSTTLETSR